MKHLLLNIAFLSIITSVFIPNSTTISKTQAISKTKFPSNVLATVLPYTPVAKVQPLSAVSTPTVAYLPTVQVAVVQTPVYGSNVIPGCGDNYYANYIFTQESGCNLTAVNPYSGDYGIGQSGGGLSSACPDWRTDYSCQNSFFNNYAISRYGSWYNAYEFKISNGWW